QAHFDNQPIYMLVYSRGTSAVNVRAAADRVVQVAVRPAQQPQRPAQDRISTYDGEQMATGHSDDVVCPGEQVGRRQPAAVAGQVDAKLAERFDRVLGGRIVRQGGNADG